MARAWSRKSLAGRTFALLFALTFVVMLCASVAATAACFSVYEGQAEDLLLSQAEAYAESLEGETKQQMVDDLSSELFVDTRCTLIDKDGSVLFDSYADAASLGNHGDREEVLQALNSGRTVVMRNSETLGTDTLYAACLVRDGIVLRLAETRTSLASFLPGIALPLIASLLIIFALSFMVSRFLIKMIVRPLRDIDLSKPLENDAYEELQPLLGRVDEQRKELERQNCELERAMTVRREFTGNVSHEMKTPLQVIGGYAELMEAGVVSPEDTRKFAGLIRAEAASMSTLINDVLTLSRLDEHAVTGKSPVFLAQVARRVASRLETRAAEREVSLDLRLDDDAMVQGDEALAEQMIYNLVDNAIRYNKPQGTVIVSVSVRGDTVQVLVSDEGPGVPVDQRDRIFERFYRLDASRSRETGGTGLGLAIVKHAVETFDGSVEVTDAVSGGALFRVLLPRG